MKKRTLNLSLAILSLVFVLPLAAGQGHRHTDPANGFKTIIGHYESIYSSLVGDSIEGIPTHSKAIVTATDSISADFSAEKAGVSADNAVECKKLLPEISNNAAALAKAGDLGQARQAFADLSQSLVRYREMASGEKPRVAYCPMAKKPWLQESEKIANPYYGSKMLRCGSIVSK